MKKRYAIAVLLFSSPLHAQTFQSVTPREHVSSEEDVGCPIPTLAECQAPNYFTEDPCGILQARNTWTCWHLLDNALEEDEGQAEVGIVAYEIEPLGVSDDVIAYPEEPLASQEAYYVADAFTFGSQTARPNFGLASDLGFDIYTTWRESEDRIISCQEYVYEKYFDQTEFERLVGVAQHDYRRVFEIAYDDAYKDASIGSRHINSDQLLGFNGTPYAQMFSGVPRPKNEFFRAVLDNTLPGNSRVAGAPRILASLRDYNAEGQLFYNAVFENYGAVNETWAWHKEMSETLSVEGKKELGLTFRPPDDGGPSDPFLTLLTPSFGEDNDDINEEIAPWTGTVPEDQSGGKFLRRYLDAELDEFYNLQRRLLRAYRDWFRADRRFAGSGWTVDRIAEEEPGEISSFIRVSQQAPSFPGSGAQIPPQFDSEFDDEEETGGLPPSVFPVAGFNVEASEDVVRRRILEDILRLYRRAEAAGCLEAGLTPCDWSPKLFARTVLHRHNDLREADFDLCNEFVPTGDMSQVTNLDIRFIDEPVDRCPDVAATFNCGIQTGPTITGEGLENLMFDVNNCLSTIPAYLAAKAECEEQLAIEAATARVMKIDALVDPSTGEVRAPGIRDGGSEDKGNRWFGLNYAWEYGFGSEIGQQECDLDLFAGGFFNLTGTALGESMPIIDAMAEVSTEDRRADIFFEVLTVPLLPAFRENFDIDTTITVNVVRSVSENRDFVSGGTRFFVGPIPVRLSAGVAGGGGVRMNFIAGAEGFGQGGTTPSECPSGQIIAGVEPHMQVSGFVEAGLDVVVAAIGIRGELTLIRAAVPFDATLNINAIPNNEADLDFPQNLQLSVETQLGLTINTLSGAFKVFCSIGFCPFCKKASKTLFQWDGLTFERAIFSQDYEVFLGDLILVDQN